MDFKKLKNLLRQAKEPDYRFRQIYEAVFKNLCFDFSKITSIPKKLREKLKNEIKVLSLELEQIQEDNNVIKALFKLHDRLFIETVLMKHKDGRKTICVSSAVGCPLGCRFCATGLMKFKRNLNWQEIVDQVLFFAKKRNERKPNIVFMGMGEPFLNYDEVLGAIRVLNNKNGFNLSMRSISISTAGVIPQIKKFQDEKLQVNLAISLNCADDKQRSYLMPVNKKYPLKDLVAIARNYVRTTKRKLFFEFVMLKDINDDLKSARKLAKILKGEPLFHVNLVRYNETKTEFSRSDEKTIFLFKKELEKFGLKVTIRHSFGTEIRAGCGQLASNKKLIKE